MAVLPILIHPDPVLRRKAKPVQKINASVRKLIADMVETMYAAPGIGLAAPQVGVSKRIIVCDVGDQEQGLLKLINPEIVQAEGQITWTEGCLSIPGYIGEVQRFARVKVAALNEEGHRVWVQAEQILAVCLQHEIDHLDGVLYVDKARDVREVQPEKAEAEGAGAAPPDGAGANRAGGAAASQAGSAAASQAGGAAASQAGAAAVSPGARDAAAGPGGQAPAPAPEEA